MAVWTSARARATTVGAGLVARTSARVCSSHFSTTLSLGDGPHWLKLNSDFGPIGIPDPGDGGGLELPARADRTGPGLVTTSTTAKPRARARAPLRFLDTRWELLAYLDVRVGREIYASDHGYCKSDEGVDTVQFTARDRASRPLLANLTRAEWSSRPGPTRTCRVLRISVAIPTGSGLGRPTRHAAFQLCAAAMTPGRPSLRGATDSVETLAFRVRSQIHERTTLVKQRLIVIVALVGLLCAVVISRAGAATQSTSPVMTFDGAVVGSSTLNRTGSGISVSLHTTGLPAGHAVTVWWMVFNHPAACITGTTGGSFRCGMADMDNPAAGLSVLYAAGHVIDGSGAADFGGSLAEGDADGAIMGAGLDDAAAADVHLVVRDHGPADPGMVDRQIHTFGNCTPTCTDLQMSVHQAR